jgi:hypothetical protein
MAERLAHVVPMAAALRDFPSVSVEGADLDGVRNGRPLDLAGDDPARDEGGPVAVLDPDGDLVAVYEAIDGRLRPAAVLGAAGAPVP